VVQIVGFNAYLKTDSKERRAALKALHEELQLPANVSFANLKRAPVSGISEEQRTQVLARVAELDTKLPTPERAKVKDLVDHIDYAVKLIGLEHVGISSDFDGGGGIDGWNDASETFNVTLELVRRGYNEAEIGKLWSGNLLRVMGEVEKVALSLQPAK
jgi:membrane dipeptidase